MGSTRPDSFQSNRKLSYPPESERVEPSISALPLEFETLFPGEMPTTDFRKEKEAVDPVFQSLLAEANRDLARLLRDLRGESDVGPDKDAPSRSVSELLLRAVRCAVKQYMLQAELCNLALTDDLTGLHNRRGFLALAEQQLKLGRRSSREILLFFIDVDGLKRVNDSFGHFEGDLALIHTAEVLEKTFRGSDLIARFGGDEFTVLAIEASGHSEGTIKARLSEQLRRINAKESRYALSLSLGVARFDPRSTASIGQLMLQADQAMYEQKRRRPIPLKGVAHASAH